MDQEFVVARLREERERRTRLNEELGRLRARPDADDPGIAQRIANLTQAARNSNDLVQELEDTLQRYDHLERAAVIAGATEAGADFGEPPHPAGIEADERRSEAFREAQNVIEEHLRSGEITTTAADKVDEVLRGDDLRIGEAAQWVAAHGQPHYRGAFLKYLQYGDSCWTRFTSDEIDAMQQVQKSEAFRALAESTGPTGGYGLPISIDPTILLQSNGAINPIRQLATVRTVGAYQLRLVTTDTTAVTAAYAAEGTEVGDNSPNLEQPIAQPRRWHAFVPYSVEMSADYPELQTQLLDLMADARDMLEAQKFLLGGGAAAFEPCGLLSIGVTGGLTTAQQIQTATTATLATSDVYNLRTSVPPRWLLQSQWLMSPIELDILYRLVPRASTTDPTLIDDERDDMLGSPIHQWSSMVSGATSGNNVLVFGDIKATYVVVDRIGLTAELIPNLFGANRRPTGQRGLYCYGRTDGLVQLANAARYLSVK